MFDESPKRVRSSKKEQVIHKEIVLWLHSQRIFAWTVKSTGTFDPKIKRFRTPPWYYRRGVWDIHGFYRGRPFIIEVKSENGKLSEDQTQYLAAWVAHAPPGAIYIIARSIEDVEAAFKAA